MNNRPQDFIEKHPTPAFFIIAFVITWAGSLVYFFALPKYSQLLPGWLTIPSGVIWYYGPCLAAIIVSRVSEGRVNTLGLLKRLLDWRVNWRWYAFIVLYPLGLHLAVVGLDRMLGGPGLVYFQAEGVPAGNPWLILLELILFHFFVRGIGEETGWRGFALPRLQRRRGALRASLELGLLWALWHFHPANFDALLSINGIFVFFNITLTTAIFTWLYNHTGGSLFIAALFHMTLNVAEFIVPIGIAQASLSRHILQIGLVAITAITLISFDGPQPEEETVD